MQDAYSRTALAHQDAEARQAAIRSLAGLEQQKEECRDVRGLGFLEDFSQDIRFGVRTLRKAPVFAWIAILTLALGIGANTAIFSFISTLLMRSLPVAGPALADGAKVDRPQSAAALQLFHLRRLRVPVYRNASRWLLVL